jgi:hypothetical protein
MASSASDSGTADSDTAVPVGEDGELALRVHVTRILALALVVINPDHDLFVFRLAKAIQKTHML